MAATTTLGNLANGGGSGAGTTNNAIPYWGYFGGLQGGGYLDYDPAGSQQAQQFLAGLHKYDPNASFVQSTMGESGSPIWHLQFDESKLPGGSLGGGNVDMNAGDYAPMYSTPNDHGETFDQYRAANPGAGNFRGTLFNPNAITNDPLYGNVTSPNNINWAKDNHSMLDTLGPLLVGAFGMAAPMLFGAAGLGLGAGGAAQAAIGGATGGLAAAPGGVAGLTGAAPGWITQLVRGIPNFGRSLTSGNFDPLSLLPIAGSAMGISPWLTTGARTLGELARGQRLTFNPIGAAMSVAPYALGGGAGR